MGSNRHPASVPGKMAEFSFTQINFTSQKILKEEKMYMHTQHHFIIA